MEATLDTAKTPAIQFPWTVANADGTLSVIEHPITDNLMWNAEARRLYLMRQEEVKATSNEDATARRAAVSDLTEYLAAANPGFNLTLPESGIVLNPRNIDKVIYDTGAKVKRDFKNLLETAKADRKGR